MEVEQVTGEQIRSTNETLAKNALSAIEQMRLQFVCNGSDHDKLRVAVTTLNKFIEDVGAQAVKPHGRDRKKGEDG